MKIKYHTDSEICDFINEVLRKHNIDFQVIDYVDLDVNREDRTIGWNRTDLRSLLPVDRISNYIKENIFHKTTQILFYHYLPKLEFLEQILGTRKIRLASLNKYLNNGDESEYRYFLETFGVDFPKFEAQIESIKNDIFIWCVTDRGNSERHWNEYSDKGNGVAISLEMNVYNKEKYIVDLVPVCYQLNFLNEIQEGLKNKFDLKLDITGYPFFAKYFKQQCYDWEAETRLCFDKGFNYCHNTMLDAIRYNSPNKKEYDDLFYDKTDKDGNRYILVPLKNSFLEIKIVEIFCTQEQYNQIRHLLNNENKDINIILK